MVGPQAMGQIPDLGAGQGGEAGAGEVVGIGEPVGEQQNLAGGPVAAPEEGHRPVVGIVVERLDERSAVALHPGPELSFQHAVFGRPGLFEPLGEPGEVRTGDGVRHGLGGVRRRRDGEGCSAAHLTALRVRCGSPDCGPAVGRSVVPAAVARYPGVVRRKGRRADRYVST